MNRPSAARADEPDVLNWGGAHGPAPVVCATAAWNGLGASSHQTWAFRRAALSAMAETPFRCPNGFRATMAHVRTLPPREFGRARLVRLCRGLVAELAPSLATTPRDARLAVVLGLSERYAEGGPGARARAALERVLRELLAERGFVAPLVLSIPRGHASLAHALLEAGAAFASGRIDAAVVGGLDTYYDPDAVETLLARGRLFDGENLDAIVPGEGGALALLARRDVLRRARWPALAQIELVATSREPAAMSTDLPCAGVALSRVLRAAVDRLAADGRTLAWMLGDVTGERYRTHEFQLAFPRAVAGADPRPGALTVDFLPPLLGDLGAATMPTALALAVEGFVRGDPDAATCVLHASSVTDDRGAVLVARDAA